MPQDFSKSSDEIASSSLFATGATNSDIANSDIAKNAASRSFPALGDDELSKCFRKLVEVSFEAVALLDAEGRILYTSAHGEHLLGYPAGSNLGALAFTQVHPDDALRVAQQFADLLTRPGESMTRVNFRSQHADGSWHWLETCAHNLLHDPDVGAIMVQWHDVTERMTAEQTAERTLRLLQGVLEGIPDSVFVKGHDGRYELINRAFMAISSRPATEIVGRTDSEIFGQDVGAELRKNDLAVMEGDEARTYEEQLKLHSPGRVYLSTKTPRHDADGKVIGLIGIARDITLQKAMERALEDTAERYRALLEAIPDLMFVLDGEGYIVDFHASDRSQLLMPPEQFLGRKIFEATPASIHEVIWPQCKEVFATGSLRTCEYNVPVQEQTCYYETRIVPYSDDRVLAIVHDITGLKRAQAEQQQAERDLRASEERLRERQMLESLGLLAGGIAHDFNNLLSAVLNFSSLALEQLPVGTPGRQAITHAQIAAQRAADLTQQLLAFSGRGKFVTQPLKISPLVREMCQLLQSSLPPRATIELRLDDDLPAIQADPTQLRQVVMNLLMNAAEALSSRGGSIAVTTSSSQVDSSQLKSPYIHDDLPAGCYVCLEVADNGCGMTPDTLRKIFDPFFTTKFAGRGLGLAAVLGIVRGHRGSIHAESTANLGTTFRVWFPCHDQQSPSAAAPAEESQNSESARRNAMVLVIDDDDISRMSIEAVLTSRGYGVRTARDGASGLKAFLADPGGIDLVLLDLTMPGMHGDEVFRELRREHPHQPVIIVSGYSSENIAAHFAGQERAAFVEKTAGPQHLLETVRQMLEA